MSVVPPRLFIDCSHAMRTRHRAGVQRVVWNLVEQASEQRATYNSQCTYVHRGNFRPYDPQKPLRSSMMRADMAKTLPNWYRTAAQFLCNKVGSRQLQSWLLPDRGRAGIFRPLLLCQQTYERFAPQSAKGWQEPSAGDCLLLPDAYWCRMQVWPAVAAARARGVRVATVIYDLIPMTHPQFVSPGSDESFAEYLKAAVDHSDLLVAISRTVKEECQREIAMRWPDKLDKVQLSHFELGADLPDGLGPVSDSIQQLFAPSQIETPYMMVSTFDPRKNHRYLLDSFDKLWQRQPQARLCLVGGRGWMSDELLQRIEQHPRYSRQLFKFHSMSDADLRYCYQHARGVICPSYVEGFGLPIVEALAFGRRAFLSDTPIHREVGRDACDYFKLEDADGLIHLLTKWEQQLATGQPLTRRVHEPLSWRESANQIFSQCLSLGQLSSANTTELLPGKEPRDPLTKVA